MTALTVLGIYALSVTYNLAALRVMWWLEPPTTDKVEEELASWLLSCLVPVFVGLFGTGVVLLVGGLRITTTLAKWLLSTPPSPPAAGGK